MDDILQLFPDNADELIEEASAPLETSLATSVEASAAEPVEDGPTFRSPLQSKGGLPAESTTPNSSLSPDTSQSAATPFSPLIAKTQLSGRHAAPDTTQIETSDKKSPTKKALNVVKAAAMPTAIAAGGLLVTVGAFLFLGPALIDLQPTPDPGKYQADAAVLAAESSRPLADLPQLSEAELEPMLVKISRQITLPLENSVQARRVPQSLKLTDPFFDPVQANDVVIIMRPSNRVILYRPIQNKIISTAKLADSQ